ncbi:sigma-70 family RNA polymerase sigma factor [Chitinasiproducens palmae]|uniref:RNA polymerase, sigma-24 subunit, RpoE n=1 Tax=Chitinasiproducens palmae TaxID=1770053 RepID=A0A1H2PNH3_9BURK|nr:sigma-70 family RNA polymerase sigma factor [Chitinasiproducens palmae]SDV47340.1 RNA polymerase, sigma-24 subunit, RpoE [Chitinasiproducens palmae]
MFVPSTVESLYVDHHSWLQGWLYRRLGNLEQAADIAQDTFVRLLTTDSAPATLEQPRAFLTTVARNLVSNLWRREKLERAYLDALAQLPEQTVLSEEQRALLFETLCQIDRLLDGLPAIVKRAFLLSQLEGRTHAEVADALGVSVPTVKRYLIKALEQCYLAEI